MAVSNSETANKSNRSARKKVPLAQRRRARKFILQALYQWLLSEEEPILIAKQFKETNEGKVDWEFFEDVFLDIPKNLDVLNTHLDPVLDRKPEALDPIEKSLLYLGTYELANRIDVPYKVVINESIELAKVFGATDGHKYINGVLDKLAPHLRAAEMSAK